MGLEAIKNNHISIQALFSDFNYADKHYLCFVKHLEENPKNRVQQIK